MEKPLQPFDICIVCALYEEAKAVLDEFSTRCNVSFTKAFSRLDRYAYQYTTILNNLGEPLSVLVTWLSDSGPTQTGLDLKPFLHEFRPRFVAMTGICAGYRRKVKVGDLVVAQYAYYYEEGKIIREPAGTSRHQPEMRTADPTSQVLQYARGFESWKKPVREMKRNKLNRELKANEDPRCVIAPMASGMAVRGDDPFPWLREKYNRNTTALDMEAATFYRALQAVSHIHGLVVKGVCDYADMHKNDAFHEYAARVAAVYLLSFIQEYVTEHTMPRRDAPPPSSRAGPPGAWNVPYMRNPHFTGRDDLLDRLHQQLAATGQNDSATTRRAALTQPQAIKGLGGIGKTQLAVEYAYRSRERGLYTHTLWVNAATEEAMITSFMEIASLLPLFSAKEETDQRKLLEAIKRWLEQCEQRWLLIFDNADDISLVRRFLPQSEKGSILLTTRSHAVGSLAASIEVDKMGWVEATHLLLRRANRFEHTLDEDINEAGNIVIALDYLPLALDQAGAYIEETACSLSHYLRLYQTCSKELLAQRGLQSSDYPHTVATTWSLSFQKVQQANPAAAELLRLCAFLAPDAIPEELISKGASHWDAPLQQAAADPFAFDQGIAELLKFSLVKRDEKTKSLSIHRLVQAVLLDTIEQDIQRQWAERIIRAVNDVFPTDASDVAMWPQCLRYLSQAQVCYFLIEQHMLLSIEAAHLLNNTMVYLFHHALYAIAEPLIQCALTITKQVLGPDHPETAQILNNLAVLYRMQGKYEQAEPLYERALAIREQWLGPVHPETAESLDTLAGLYRVRGKYEQAEPLYERSLAINEKSYGPEHPDTANSLNNLAELYRVRGKYEQAEPLYERALAINEKSYGPEHLDTARILNNLALLYQAQGKYEQTEPLYQRALAIFYEQQLGPEHPDTARILNNLAELYWAQNKHGQAESLYQRVLAIYEQQLGPQHPDTATCLNNLAALYDDQGKYEQAELLYQRALSIRENQLGPYHPETASSLNNLALLYNNQGKYEQAEPLLVRSLAISEAQLGSTHPETATSLNNLALLYNKQGKYEQAEPLYQRALEINKQQLGPEHPETATSLNNLAVLYDKQGKYEQAEALYQDALSIRERRLGPEHPDTATSFNNLAAFYQEHGRYAEAQPLYQRSLLIFERVMGREHPITCEVRENYASLLRAIILELGKNS